MRGDTVLISASKHHVLIKNNLGNSLLNYDYANPNEWELVE